MNFYDLALKREHCFRKSGKHPPFSFHSNPIARKEINAKHHILRRPHYRFSICWFQKISSGIHKRMRFILRLRRKREVHGHLVAIKIGVKRLADKRRNPYAKVLDEKRSKCLNAEAMQCRGAVQKNFFIFYNLFKNSPYIRRPLFYKPVRLPYVISKTAFDYFIYDKMFEELKGQVFRQSALVQFKLRTDNNNGAAGIINAFA